MSNFILSPCGTSLLRNIAKDDDTRNIANKNSNKKEHEICNEDKEQLRNLIIKAKNALESATLGEVAELSAELNAIIKFYKTGLQRHENDYHCLLTTDTWLGESTGNLLRDWLNRNGLNTAEVKKVEHLQTARVDDFHTALSRILKWCVDTIPGYSERKYKIVFNLTGGFKSVQGFLQTLAMFYADESIYVFESQDALMRIPKLPLKFVPDEVIRNNFDALRRFELQLSDAIPESFPDALLFSDTRMLNEYGEMYYTLCKNELYKSELLDPVSDQIVFGPEFNTSVESHGKAHLKEINERIEDLSRYLSTPQNNNPRRLDFKKIRGAPNGCSTHEMDAWADGAAMRIYGHYDESNCFILDKLGEHL